MAELVDVHKASAHLGIQVVTVQKWCRNGRLPNATRGPGRTDPWKIPMSDIIDALRPPPGLRPEEAAEIIGITPQSVSQACREGRLPGVRWRGVWHVSEEDAVEFSRHREGRYAYINHEILQNKEAVWDVFVRSGHNFEKAAKLCGCSKFTYRNYFYNVHGLKRPKKEVVGGKKVIRRGRGSGIPDKCRRNCPGWMAEPDCITKGGVCYYDPEQLPLDF